MNKPFIKKHEIIIIITLLLLGITGGVLTKLPSRNTTAEIYFGGELKKKIDLQKAADQTFSADGIVFYIKDHKIGVRYSPCRDKLCVRTGEIQNPSQVIVCLPEQMVIKISDKYEDENTDLIIG